jgi:serine/threonine-protein kinase
VKTASGEDRALKLLPRPSAAILRMRERFRQEWISAGKLRHPRLVQVLEYSEQTSEPYLLMEMASGWTTEDGLIVRDVGAIPKPVDEMVALSIAKQVCEVLDHVHSQAVIHCHIKPGHLLLFGRREVKLTDFGISYSSAFPRPAPSGIPDGTAEYMSPEQTAEADLTPASDIYSLGVVLYELLTGRPPFRAATPLQTRTAHLKTPVPDPQILNPTIPKGIKDIVLRCLTKQPAQRFESAGALYQALLEYEDGTSPTAAGGLSLVIQGIGNTLHEVELDGDSPVSRALTGMLLVTDTPGRDSSGRAISYDLCHLASRRILDPSRTLWEEGVRSGDTIKIVPQLDMDFC